MRIFNTHKTLLMALLLSLATGNLFGQNLVPTPSSIAFGDVPSGYWAQPINLEIFNQGDQTTVTSVTCDNGFFVISGSEAPFTIDSQQKLNFVVSTGTASGSMTGNLTISYGDNQTLVIPLSANAYTPVAPDIWELPRQVTVFPYSETFTSNMAVYDNYQLPGKKPDGKDVVFKLNLDSDVILSANVNDDLNGKTALYREDFEGLGGPMVSNYCTGLEPHINDLSRDFEDGVLGDIGWEFNGYWYRWNVTTNDSHSGTYCMKSFNEDARSSGIISLTIDVPFDITLSFWAKVYSIYGNSQYDSNNSTGYFYIDGEAKIDGLTDGPWMYYSYNVAKGTHTFEWKHYKARNLINSSNDCFYVDDIFFWDASTSSLIDGLQVPAGTYYLAVSSTNNEFTVNIDATAMPLPEVVTSPSPLDGYNCFGDATVSLNWTLGEYTKEYQVLFGETNPPTEPLVNWTNELAESHEVLTENAKTYYWRVNERNTSGTTEGPVWSFTTYREINASADNIIYVAPSPAGSRDGSSWDNAICEIQAAIDAAASITQNQPVIWVAKGTYTTPVYQMIDEKPCCILGHGGVKLFGGFDGNEPANFDLSQRDLENNATVLDAESQCYVVGTQSSEWDGFVMQHGKEGGVYANGNSIIQNCKILYSQGTGVYVNGGSFNCYHNVISHHANEGVSQNNWWYKLDIRDCEISYNGGYGVFGNYCIRCKICNNGNGFRKRASHGALIGCLVANNDGFGAECDYIVSSTIVNNGLGLSESSSGMDIIICNSIIWGNQILEDWQWSAPYFICNNAIQGGIKGGNGIFPCIYLSNSSDETGMLPEFEHPSSGIGSASSDGIWTLKPTSPCINMGLEHLETIPKLSSYFCDNTGFTTAIDYLDVDYAGNQRVKQGRIDLGAWESPYNKPDYVYPIKPDANNIIYVKAGSNGDGSSWANATSDLRGAMETILLLESVPTIWVAQGTYSYSDYPLQVKKYLKMYGGFEGNEPANYDLNQRDFVSHASVLDGNNTLRVLNQLTALSESSAAVVDGFTIRNGAANNGAGAYLLDNMTLVNCTLKQNTASDKGGGIYAENASVENCVVTSNTAQQGGGIYADLSNIHDCFVTNNTAQQGGGMFASNSQIVQSHVSNNQASINGGGAYVQNSSLLQCNVLKNQGNGIFSRIDKQDEYNRFYNTIVWGNDEESIVYSSNMSTINTALSHCAVEGFRSTANGNIPLSHDNTGAFGPRFVDPVSEVGVTESAGDWQLLESSLCINAGTSAVQGMTMPTLDLNKEVRVQQGQIDLGVYESSFEQICMKMDVREATIEEGETYDFYGSSLNETGTYEHRWTIGSCDSLVMLYLRVRHTEHVFVSENGAGTKDGSSWANALDGNTLLANGYTRLADALQNAQCDNCFWVASGTYFPCGDADASKHFVLNEGVRVYGGFAGDETSLDQRDLDHYSTVFSGELQDDNNETNNTDGIFVSNDASALWNVSACLDGITLTKGYNASNKGAALWIGEGTMVSINQCQITENREGSIYNQGVLEVKNSVLSNNRKEVSGNNYMVIPDYSGSIFFGAGVVVNMEHGIVSFDHCTLKSNYSENNGVIFNLGVLSANETVFKDNTADRIGAIFSQGKVKLTNTIFNNNRAENRLGVMMVMDSLEMVNCTLSDNHSNYYTATHFPTGNANYPGHRTSGIEAWGYSYVDHCQFLNNDAGTCLGGALSIMGTADVKNCTFIGNKGAGAWKDPNIPGGNISVIIIMGDPDGAALYVEGNVMATDCVFSENVGYKGSTIGVWQGSLTMERCKIFNSTPCIGTSKCAIKVAGDLTLKNCLLANNRDGIMDVQGNCHIKIINSTLANTDATSFIFECVTGESIIDLDNCIVAGYSEWSLSEVGNEGVVNTNHTLVSQDINEPMFVNPTTVLGYDENLNPLDANWTLQAGSPCINAGDVTLLNPEPLATDLAGELRVKNGQIDMGAYEYGTIFNFIHDGNWNVASNWNVNAVPTSTDEVFIKADCQLNVNATVAAMAVDEGQSITLQPEKTLNVSGRLINANASGIVIEDGAQLHHTNDVPATLHKEITGFGSNNSTATGWYTIASPIMDEFSVNGLTSGTYDLYSFIEKDIKWYNQKAHAENFTTLAPNTGYLYANSVNKTLEFAGETPATNTTNVTVPLSYMAQGDLAGYNLVGNPFTRSLTANDVIKIGNETLTTYLTVDGGDDLVAHDISTDPILPGQGFFVQVSETNQNLVINYASRSVEKVAKPAFIRIETCDGNFTDRAYVQIGHGNTLRKMNLSDETPIVYVMHEGKDFAAATIEETSGEMPVNFRAVENADHTITVNTEGLKMNYLHLIDNLTGANIDLLVTPSYTFSARNDDYASRFKLVFSAQLNGDEDTNEDFAFIHDGEIVIEGEGIVQVIDMTGRIIARRDTESHVSTAGMTPGVYVLQLINGENVRTQKMVIK